MKMYKRYISFLLVFLFSVGFFPQYVMATPNKTDFNGKIDIAIEKVDDISNELYENIIEQFNQEREIESDIPIEDYSSILDGYRDNVINEVTLQNKQVNEIFEVEPNNSINVADVISDNVSSLYSYIIYGLIDYEIDLDFYRFTLPTKGEITSLGFWIGNYRDYGWEDDLLVGILDSKGTVIEALSLYELDNGKRVRGFIGDLDAGTYYLMALANNDYGPLYVNEIYALNLLFEPVSIPAYTVSFNSNGGSYVAPVSATQGTMVTKPADPVKGGYSFGGWYRDSQLLTPWNFTKDVVNQNTVLYAKWNTSSYQVGFISNGGTAVVSQTVIHGGYVSEPAMSSKTGYKFSGWFKDQSLTNPWDFNYDRVYSNTSLYAKWQPIQLEVRFETSGGSTVAPRNQNYDSLIIKPSDPALSGYHFGGWYLEDTYTTLWDFTIMRVKQNMTLYARWISKDAYNVVAGANRYYTAAEISKNTYEEADTVILASGMNYPDALTGGPLAYLLHAPILLTQQSRIPKGTLDEIIRLGATKVIILGSESAVSGEVVRALTDLGIMVERLEGASRYTTAIEVAKRVQTLSGKSSRAVLASGMDFADALSAGSYAAMEGIPILLTRSDRMMGSLSDALVDLGIQEVILIGGTSAVNPVIEEAVKALGIQVTRYSGANRYLTATVIADNFYKDATEAVIANGMTFPDALAAVPMAARLNAPIILSGNGRISTSVLSYIENSGLSHVTFVGGESVIPEAVRTSVAQVLQ